MPGLLSTTLKDCLPSIIQESLQTHIPASSEQFAEKQTKLNKKMVKHLNRQFNIFHVAQSDRFVRLEMKLFKKLKSNMGKSVMSLVRSGMQEVRDDLNTQAKSLGKFCQDVQGMQTQLFEIQSLLKSAVIIDDTAEGEKNKKDKDEIPAAIQGEHPPAKTIPSSEQIVERKELVVHTSEEKNSEGIMSVEDDSDEDDKQTLSKRFKITTPILDIPNLIPLNTFVPEHLLKPKEQQKSVQEFTDQLFEITSLKFSPTPPRELTPPRDSPKGKFKSFITLEGPLSQEEYIKQIKEMKRLYDLKAEQEKSEQELRKLLNPATLKAQA
ncbi:hypothetical protein Tco_0967036 [Tanacetum coccineum]